MKKHSKEFIIGLSVLAALALVFFGINYLKGINLFKTSNYYYVTYTNVAGLTQSAPVTLNGFKVGMVREINYDYDNPGHINVELSLDRHLKITRNTKAIIVVDMLGTATIELEMGPEKDFHDVGDKIIGVTSTGMMDNLSKTLVPSITDMVPKVDSLLVAVTNLASDPALLSSIKRLDVVMANLEQSSALLSATLKSMPTVAGNANTVMTDATAISANLKTISNDLTQVSHSLAEMPLDATLNNIAQVSDNLNKLLANLNSDDSSLGLLMKDPELYRNLNNSAASLDSLLRDVKKNPKRYISIKLL